ncbi:flippase [Klebsiella grimontii]|uniref:flippase n=1 Tax=Klebsiella grimontii TaxID=2058152 RepID=UPI00237BF58C|nr:flippase [Klebsiella grimontii]MDD9676430.1 flippase [Klebsiella grimontii]MDD9679943.1 flippase [Klebsiella grimontii]MDD9692500.1 flippase [Klebsiella grimontii]MDD9699650.1 flippase [Klebsiella grimontii]MDD9714585.1 flippase [Klebsiella grimontii]
MQSYIKNAGWIFLEKILRTVITFVLFALISRQLGPSDTGILNFSQSIAIMFLCVTGLGLDSILINEFSKNKDASDDQKLYSTVMLSKFLISIVVLIICIAGLFFSNISNVSKSVFVISLLSLVFQTQNTFFSFFQAKSKSYIVTKYSLIALVISSIVKIFLIFQNVSIVWYAVSYTFDVLVSFIIIEYQMRVQRLYIRLKLFEKAIILSLLKKSYPIILSSLLVVLYTRLDQIMILKMMGTESLGIFSVAIRISDAYAFIPAAVATSFFPLLTHDNSAKNLKLYFDLVFFSSFTAAIGVIIFSWLFLEKIFGASYSESFSILSITVFSTVFAVMGGACTNYLVTVNLTFMRLVRATVGLFINFLLNIWWIPKYGLIGAAYASLFSQVFSAFLGNLLNKKTWECFYLQLMSIITLGIPGILTICQRILRKHNDKD